MSEIRSFLTIERTIGSVSYAPVAAMLARVERLVREAVADDDHASALALIGRIDLSSVKEKLIDELGFYARSAFMYGAARVHGGIKKTPPTAIKLLDPELLSAVLIVHANIMADRNAVLIAQSASDVVANHQAESAEVAKFDVVVRKLDLADKLNAAVDGTARMMSSISANLTTSRLASYGFLSSAVMYGVTKYQLQAVLDERTSDICRALDGRIFEVRRSFDYLDRVLRVTNPEELKTIAPFVSGTKASIEHLRGTSDDDLAAEGVMVPPFHPYCRTILVTLESDEVDYQDFPVDTLDTEHLVSEDVLSYLWNFDWVDGPWANKLHKVFVKAKNGGVPIDALVAAAKTVPSTVTENTLSDAVAELVATYGTVGVKKFNPYHDPKTGKFTTADGVGGVSEFTPEDFEKAGIDALPGAQAHFNEFFKGVTPEEFSRDVAGGMERKLKLSVRMNSSDEYELHCDVELFENGEKVGEMLRVFNHTTGTVTHENFELYPDFQGVGFGKKILSGQFSLYKKLGFRQVFMLANIDVGGYAWAKYGFLPQSPKNLSSDLAGWLGSVKVPNSVRSSVKTLLKQMPADPKVLWAISDLQFKMGDTTLGKVLLKSSSWRGIFNLGDEAAMKRFNSYVGKK